MYAEVMYHNKFFDTEKRFGSFCFGGEGEITPPCLRQAITCAVSSRLYGANGVEISVHEFCAPDHKDIQGKQLTKAEYSIWQAAHAYPKRQIGHLNCHHFAFAIVLGISPPNYSQSELAEINARNDKGITYEGQHYTMYECTQIQRQLETAIRRYSDIKVMADSAGDEKLVAEMQGKIDKITRKYEDFSAKANLRVKSERLNMYGYKRKNNNQS